MRSRKNSPTESGIPNRCEGWRRHGGAFTLGPVHWEQCASQGAVILTISNGKEIKTLPACKKCWEECIENKLNIIKVTPIPDAILSQAR